MLTILRKSQLLPISLTEAWDFFSNPNNLASITPPKLGFRVLSESTPQIYPGLILCYSVRPFPGFRTGWVSEITQVKPFEYFIDEQRSGPYRIWHHEHFFRKADQGTVVEDLIHYCLPFGFAGNLVAGAFVRRQLESLFAFRSESMRKRFGAV